MKKILSILLCSMVCLTVGCTNTSDNDANTSDQGSNTTISNQDSGANTSVPSADVITIQDDTFITQSNDIYNNPDEYKDKLIMVQGIHATASDGEKHYVIRGTKLADGSDKNVGFEFKFNGEYPEGNEWIEVLGNIESSTGTDGNKIVVINAERVDIQETKGQEFVTN